MQILKLLVLVAVATILSACNNGSDITAPVISLSGTSTVTVEAGSVYTDAGAAAIDDSDGNITTGIATVNPVNTAIVGSYTVTYNVSDISGNAASEVTRTVNVVDTIAPVISLSGASPFAVIVGTTYTDAGATAADSLDGNITANIVTLNGVNAAIVGSYTVTYNVFDANGNAATEVVRTVNVITPPAGDTTLPIISLNGSSLVSVTVGGGYTELGATATDNVDNSATITANIVINNSSVNTAVVGTYSVTYNVSDAAGNAAVPVTRTVNVVAVADTTKPVITLNGLGSVTLDVGSAYVEAGATATDNVDNSATITANIVINSSSVNTALVGVYSVTYNVSDAAGNAAVQVTRTVNVVAVADTTKPVINLTGSSSLIVEVGIPYVDAGATASDNIDGDITANIVTANPVNTAVVAIYSVTYNVTDAAGNLATQVTRTVSVADSTAPVITLQGSGTVNISVGDTYTDAGATATDNYDSSVTVTVGGDTVDTATAATYTITYNAFDAAGNAATEVTRSVTVAAATGAVGAYYPAAPNWNDYVKNDSTSEFNATNTPADATETGGYSAVIHGGEMRSVNLGVTNCSDQAATDALGAFNWVCDDSTGTALMVSTGLKEGKNLSDLLDFATQVWKNNSVTITGTGAVTTTPAAWWSNPVTLANVGGSLATSGTVYVVTVNPAASYKIDADNISLVIQPGITLTVDASVVFLSVIEGKYTLNFIWVEGTLDATGGNTGLFLRRSRFSVLRNLSVSNSLRYGIRLDSTSINNSLSNITAINNVRDGIFFESRVSYNSLSNATVANNGRYGIYLYNQASNNSLSDITSTNNVQDGIFLSTQSKNNRLLNITVANNGRHGVYLYSASNNNRLTNIIATNNLLSGVYLDFYVEYNSLSNITSTGNGDYGVYFNTALNNDLSNVTAVNNGKDGVNFQGGTNNTLSNIAAVNSGANGVSIISSTGNSLLNIAAANNVNLGIRHSNSSDSYFTGLLKVGLNANGNCQVNAPFVGGLPGLVDVTCANESSSDATLTTGVTLAASYVGKVMSDDTANSSDTTGAAASYPVDPASFDWLNFDNIYRGWGIDGSAFPNADQQGQWTTGTGRIWDWSLANGDTGDASNPAIQNVLTAQLSGDVANTIEHGWKVTAADQAACTALVPGSVWNAADDCRSTYLRNATEIIGDNIGNDNGLCESDETCLFTPNIGSYQGHGGLTTAGTFTDGDTLTGITLRQYLTNGY